MMRGAEHAMHEAPLGVAIRWCVPRPARSGMPWWRMQLGRHGALQLAMVLAIACLVSAHARAAHIYQFAAPGVTNLSRREVSRPAEPARDVPREWLDAEAADEIRRRTDCGADGPWQLAILDSDDRQARAVEPQRLASARHSVRRAGTRLVITPAQGKPIVFTDWSVATTRTREGDAETFIYAGTLVGSHYHRVEVRYGHDAPGSFLVHPTTGKTAYAHNGGNVVAATPNGLRLAAFETLNAPYPLVVAALDAHGPAVELRCRGDAGATRVTGAFCGWRDNTAFEVQFTSERGPSSVSVAAVARLTRLDDGHWRLFVSDDADTAVCMQCREFIR